MSEPAQTDSPFSLSGTLELRQQTYLEQSGNLSQRLRAILEPEWESGRWYAYVQNVVEYDAAVDSFRDRYRNDFLQAYLRYDGDRFDLTLGKQRINWGVADGRATIDRINAFDLRDPIGNAQTPSRRPTAAAHVKTEFGQSQLELVFAPAGPDLKLPEWGSPWEPGALAQLRRSRNDTGALATIADPDDPEGGARWFRYGRGMDLGVAVFRGSTAAIRPSGDPDLLRFESARATTFNLSFAMAAASASWRAELAYTPDAVMPDSQRGALHQFIAGWDRTFGADFYVNVQFFADLPEEGPDDVGSTFALTKSVFDTAVEVGFRGQLASRGQRVLEGYADWNRSDRLHLVARIVSFSGNSGTPFGPFAENDYAELSARWSF